MLVTNKAIDFKVDAVMPDNSIKSVSMKELMGENGLILFFWPKDFTFVCPTEIIAFNNRLKEFHDKGFNLAGISCDSEMVHLAWKNTEVSNGGIGKIDFPILADIKKEIARAYDVLFDDAITLRATFIIDKDKNIRHATINDLPLGRNIDETLRLCDAINFVNEHGEVCPANWKKGQDTMKPTSNGVADYLKKHAKNI